LAGIPCHGRSTRCSPPFDPPKVKPSTVGTKGAGTGTAIAARLVAVKMTRHSSRRKGPGVVTVNAAPARPPEIGQLRAPLHRAGAKARRREGGTKSRVWTTVKIHKTRIKCTVIGTTGCLRYLLCWSRTVAFGRVRIAVVRAEAAGAPRNRRGRQLPDAPSSHEQGEHVSVAAQTPDEVRVTERYLSVLADVSRCAEAVRHGDWRHLAGTADDLCRRAALLAEAASQLEHTGPGPRGGIVAKLVASRNDSSPAARLLHPAGTATIAKTAMTDPFTHPAAQPNPSA
jgi:hypothetical protein